MPLPGGYNLDPQPQGPNPPPGYQLDQPPPGYTLDQPKPQKPWWDKALHGAATAAETVQHFGANLPVIREAGDIYRGTKETVLNTPVVDPETGESLGTTYGEALKSAGQAVAGQPAVQWAEARLGNAPGVKQIGEYMRAHPEQTRDIIMLVNAGMNAAQILPIVGLGVAGVRAAVGAATRGLVKKATKDIAESGTAAAERGMGDILRPVPATQAPPIAPHPATPRPGAAFHIPPEEVPAPKIPERFTRPGPVAYDLSPGHLSDDLYRLTRDREADAIKARQTLKSVKISPDDAEAIYHWREDHNFQLTESQRKLAETLEPLRGENQRIKAKLQPRLQGIINAEEEFTERYAVDRNNVFDRLVRGVKQISGGILTKGGPDKHRVMHVLEDANGVRTVAAIKGGRVYKFENGKAVDIGAYDLKTREDLLDKHLRPFETESSILGKQLEELRKTKTSSPSVIEGLENDLRDLNTRATETALEVHPSAAQDLIQESKLYEQRLADVRSATRGDQWLAQRISTMQRRLDAITQKMDQIKAEYDPYKLDERVFTDKSGRQYKITQATTKEIEGETGVRYHKNALANDLVTNLRLRQAERASDFLENLKSHPDFGTIARKADEIGVPDNWKKVNFPQLQQFRFDPKVADALNRFASHFGREPAESMLEGINRFLRTAIFFSPLIHVPNIAVHYFVDKGLLGTAASLFSPKSYRALSRAWKAIMTQNEDFQFMLRNGAPLKAVENQNRRITEDILALLSEEHPNAIRGAISKLNPYKFSSDVTWITNDLATLHRIYERMDAGMTIEKAIEETGKHIPNYRIPGQVLGQKWLADVMSAPLVTMFGPYHYGALRSYGEIARDAFKAAKIGDVKTLAQLTDKVAMLGFIQIVMYPQIDKAVQAATGDPRAYIRRAGATTFPHNIGRVRRGEMSPLAFLESVFTPAPVLGAALREASPYGFSSALSEHTMLPEDKRFEVLKRLGSLVSPIGAAERALVHGFAPVGWQFLGVSQPHLTPAERALKESGQQQGGERTKRHYEVLDAAAKGDMPRAQRIVDYYNNYERNQFVKARESINQPPTQEEIDNYVNAKGLQLPSQEQIDTYKQHKSLPPELQPIKPPSPYRKPKFKG